LSRLRCVRCGHGPTSHPCPITSTRVWCVVCVCGHVLTHSSLISPHSCAPNHSPSPPAPSCHHTAQLTLTPRCATIVFGDRLQVLAQCHLQQGSSPLGLIGEGSPPSSRLLSSVLASLPCVCVCVCAPLSVHVAGFALHASRGCLQSQMVDRLLCRAVGVIGWMLVGSACVSA